jgi:hypothetical protein
MVASKSAFLAPIFTAIPKSWANSLASSPKNMHAEDAVCHAITAREAIHLTFAGNPLATAL